ncbi:unnamed protein product [Arctogadus glacialis]
MSFALTTLSVFFLDDARGWCATERRCDHALQQVTLAEVKQSVPGQLFHVSAQLKSYQPRPLYQALKLHCPKCRAMSVRPAPPPPRPEKGLNTGPLGLMGVNRQQHLYCNPSLSPSPCYHWDISLMFSPLNCQADPLMLRNTPTTFQFLPR